MDNKGKRDSSECDKTLVYSQTYAQNSDLLKYFRDIADVNLRHIKTDACEQINPYMDAQKLPMEVIEHGYLPYSSPKIPSPTSSVTSNRKLEWDNGADIGYKNCGKRIKKSISLPILNDYAIQRENLFVQLEISPSANFIYKTKEDLIQSSISSAADMQGKCVSTSSSDEPIKTIPIFSGSSSSQDSKLMDVMNYLRCKVGDPTAQSTPLDTFLTLKNQSKHSLPTVTACKDSTSSENTSTSPKLMSELYTPKIIKCNQSSIQNILNMDSSAKVLSDNNNRENKQKKLQISTSQYEEVPSSVTQEYVENTSNRTDKSFETSFPVLIHKPNLKSNKCLENSNKTILKIYDSHVPQEDKYYNILGKKQQNLCVSTPICVDYVGSLHEDKIIQTSIDNISVAVQTITPVKENKNKSQHILYGDVKNFENYGSNNSVQTESDISNCNSFEFLDGSDCNKILSSNKTVDEYFNKKCHSNQSNSPTINQASGKSSPINQNCLSDVETEQKSEMLLEIDKKLNLLYKLNHSKKYNNETKKYYIKTVLRSILKGNYSDDISLYSEKITPNITHKIPYIKSHESNVKKCEVNKLHSNVPWVPTMHPEESREKIKKVRNPIHTLPHEDFLYQYEAPLRDNKIYSSTSTSKKSGNISSDERIKCTKDNENESWKVNKTLSEQLFEQKLYEMSSGDSPTSPNEQLLRFAKQEHENQIKWINNEIQHLIKLKKLLEIDVNRNKVSQEISSDRKKSSKSTEIYMISKTKSMESKHRNEETKCSEFEFQVKSAGGVHNYIVNEICSNNIPCDKKNPTECIPPKVEEVITTPVTTSERSNFEQSKDTHRKKEDKSTSSKERALSPKNKMPFNFENAVIISSESKPGDTVKRVILEVPLDSNIEISNEVECNKQVQTSKSLDYHLTSSSTSCSASTTYSTETKNILCSCCRQFAPIGLLTDDGISLFCETCLLESIKNKQKNLNPENQFFELPQHKCRCYSNRNTNENKNVNNSAFDKIRNGVKEMHELGVAEDDYKCAADRISPQEGISNVCKLKRNSRRSKKPIAYLLTLEPGDLDFSQITNKPKSLDEVRIKIPMNEHKRQSERLYEQHMEKNEEKQKKHKFSKKNQPKTSLQEYLENNNPSFIKAAEERRKCLVELAYMREHRCEKYKQLLALTNGISTQNINHPDSQKKRLFSSREMHIMTSKKYKKLPEVQQKLLESKNINIKKANRLLANIYAKKLRDRVLQGHATISTSTSIINLF